jgi:polar amino acid transport system permease protein
VSQPGDPLLGQPVPTLLAPPRRKVSRRDTRRSAVIALVSTLVFVGLIVLALYTAPGAAAVRNAFFNPQLLAKAFPEVGHAFLINIRAFLIAEVFILAFALLLAVLRTLPGPAAFPVRVMAIAYIDLFRGLPLILVLFVVSFGLPGLNLAFISTRSIFQYGVFSLVLVYSAYVAEVYRAGIESVHESQMAAARSLGLSRWKSMRFVILPQAIRRVIPPLLNDFIGLQKDTALLSVIGVVEAARTAQDFGTTNATLTGYVVAAFLFVIVTIPLARFLDRVIAKQQRRQRAGTLR